MNFLLPPRPQRLSCGVLIVNAERELLLCHVTGQDHWDLPKGGLVEGESPLEAALRETEEETGLALAADALTDLGRFDYRRRKALHLFATLMPRLDVATLGCTSHFSDLASGARLPEMDDYAWFDFADVSRHTTRRMAAVLAGRIELDRLLARLAAPAGERARRRDNGGVQAGAADAPAHRLSHARAAHP
ncbi:MAG: NUDIX domain-containing protein [Ideonella sp.]|nr:NUDIX domain-containing protein [Ideonella sp.]